MKRIGDWFSTGSRAITLGTIFILLVLLGLTVTPIVTSELAIGAHSHIREAVDPLDRTASQIQELVANMELCFLHYVVSGNPSHLNSYEEAVVSLRDTLLTARIQAERLGPVAERHMDELQQAIARWRQFAEPIIALRKEGRASEAQAAAASDDGDRLIDDVQQRLISLHEFVHTAQDSDRDRIDQFLNAQVILGLTLGVLGIVAAVMVARLARRISRLNEELRTERRHAEELAKRERRRANELDATIESITEGVMVVEQSGQIIRLNHTARQILESPWPQGLYGHFSELGQLDLRYPDGRPMPLEERPINRVLHGESLSNFEAIYLRSNGRKYHLQFGGATVRDDAGRLLFAVIVFHDITIIRELEQQREEFISVVAHDLRNPLTAITGFAGFLSRLSPDKHNTDQERKAIDTIEISAKRLGRMINDLLDASRIESKQLALAKEEVDLPEFVREVVERAAKITEGHPVQRETRGTVPPIQADPTRLEQILTNLLSNAAKYSYPETEILVQIQSEPGEVMVSVTNQGPGISPEDHPQLFSRFHRIRAAKEEKVPGIGLGLYITKGLVEAHGGRIWVESESGRYATFRFTLPVS